VISSAATEKIKEIVGAPHVRLGADRGPYLLEGRTPDAVAFPGSVEEVSQLLALASDEGIAVIPWGGGTKMSLGAPPKRFQLVVGLNRLNLLLEHEPGDLTATAQAGITHEAFQTALARARQWLSLDPPFASQATFGGIISTNSAGPKRHLYGSARDLVIGIGVVAADGVLVRGGGKVVKNVAGYDLPKLYIGALGSLGIVVELTVKLRPLPEDDALLVGQFPGISEAASASRALMDSDLIPNAIELLDREAANTMSRVLGREVEGVALLIGFDGLAAQVAWQLGEAEQLVAKHGATTSFRLSGALKETAWQFVREINPQSIPAAQVQCKIAVLPTQVVTVFTEGERIARRGGVQVVLVSHFGLGLVTALFAQEKAGQEAGALVDVVLGWRELVRGMSGQLAIETAPLTVKEKVSVWDPPDASVRIMERIKAELDPKGILNPGRFVGDI
jgi:glycolate oxidase FAD binding subunit